LKRDCHEYSDIFRKLAQDRHRDGADGLFSAYCNIVNVDIPTNRAGFVSMVTPQGARTAIHSLNRKILGSGMLTLSEISLKEESVNSIKAPLNRGRRASYLY
jgi:hypothetical protein